MQIKTHPADRVDVVAGVEEFVHLFLGQADFFGMRGHINDNDVAAGDELRFHIKYGDAPKTRAVGHDPAGLLAVDQQIGTLAGRQGGVGFAWDLVQLEGFHENHFVAIPGLESVLGLLNFFLRRRRRRGLRFPGLVKRIGQLSCLVSLLLFRLCFFAGRFGFALFHVLLLANSADFFGLQRPDPLRLFQLTQQTARTEIQLDRRRHVRPLIAERGNRVAKFLGRQAARERPFEHVGLF